MFKRLGFLSLFCFSLPLFAQQTEVTPQRHPQAVELLEKCLRALGASPQDSVATGTVTLEAGGRTESGTLRLATAGTTNWKETTTIAAEESFSRNADVSKEKSSGVAVKRSLEWLASGQTPYFPTPLLAEALQNEDYSVELLPQEAKAIRLRITNTFKSAGLRDVAEFTRKEVWIDPDKYLPTKVLYQRKHGSGSYAAIPMELRFSDFRLVGGIQYPHQIEVLMNGTHWKSVTMTSVLVNTGSTEAADVR